MKERFKKYKEIMNELNDRGVSLLELEIWNEIDCQLDKELTDNQLDILYCTVERAYFKGEEVDLSVLVNYCINNINKIYDMNIWDILIDSMC